MTLELYYGFDENRTFFGTPCVHIIIICDTHAQGPYVGGNRHGAGQLVKSDGEERTENYKEGKLVNFTVTKPAE